MELNLSSRRILAVFATAGAVLALVLAMTLGGASARAAVHRHAVHHARHHLAKKTSDPAGPTDQGNVQSGNQTSPDNHPRPNHRRGGVERRVRAGSAGRARQRPPGHRRKRRPPVRRQLRRVTAATIARTSCRSPLRRTGEPGGPALRAPWRPARGAASHRPVSSERMPSSERPPRRGRRPRRLTRVIAAVVALLAVCGGAAIAMADPDDLSAGHTASRGTSRATTPSRLSSRPAFTPAGSLAGGRRAAINVYSHTLAGMLTPVTRRARYLVYVPDSQGNGVYVINPRTYRVIDYFATGAIVQHVVPAGTCTRFTPPTTWATA